MSTDAKLGLVAGVLAVVGVAAFGGSKVTDPAKPATVGTNPSSLPPSPALVTAVPAATR